MNETIKSPIIALFDSQAEADVALSHLRGRAIPPDQIKVVDKPVKAVVKEPTAIDTVGASLNTNEPRLQPNPIPLEGTVAGAGQIVPVINLEEDLTGLGVSADGVRFFANGVRNGGTLVIITPGSDAAPTIYDLMNAAGASKVTHG